MKYFALIFIPLLFTLNLKAANPKIEIKTNMGTMVIELYPKKAPKTVKNFLEYVKSGFYTGTIFHRVIDNFMIQGGGFEIKKDKEHKKLTRAPIKNEAKKYQLKNTRGTIAMARTAKAHSATSQFFINHKDNDFLNPVVGKGKSKDKWGYTVFGEIKTFGNTTKKDSESVLDRIASTKITKPNNAPVEKVIIESIKLIDEPK